MSVLDQALGYAFASPALRDQALTHRSFGTPNNERLEFLGDGVLSAVIAGELYLRFPTLQEGELSRLRASLVRENTLFEIAQRIDLASAMRLGEGEARSGGRTRPSILADGVEALIGAAFLDGGFEAARAVIRQLYGALLDDAPVAGLDKDPKTASRSYSRPTGIRCRPTPWWVRPARHTARRSRSNAWSHRTGFVRPGWVRTGALPSRRPPGKRYRSCADRIGAMSFHCGTVAIVGRPNVGKSTLLNRLIGQKLAITSRRPQTTRHALRGLLTTELAQFVFVDTPGFQTRHGGAMNRTLNRTVRDTLADVDVTLLVLAAGTLGDEDEEVIALLPAERAIVVAVNKLDTQAGPQAVLPFLARLQARLPRATLVPVSAKTGKGKAQLLAALQAHLPEQPAIFPADALTDRDERFLAAELIREKLFRAVGEEVPYGSAVQIDDFKEDGRLRRIHASILVDRPGHKLILLGPRGERLKAIATAARIDMEKLFDGKVYLEVWIKVKSGWTESAASLRQLGLE